MMGAELAIDAELTRIVRIAENADSYRHRELRLYAYKILKDVFPDKINQERWQIMSGKVPDTSLVREGGGGYTPAEDLALLREHGRQICCPTCNQAWAATLRAELAAQDEPEDDPCDHGETSGEWLVRCRYCEAARDCDHADRSCQDCDRCEAEHDCRDCGSDPDCEHSWYCRECDEQL